MNYRRHILIRSTVLAATLLATQVAVAQGGIRWPGVTTTPNAYVIQVDERHVDIYVPGWVTHPGPGGENPDCVGVGLGIEGSPVRTIDKSEFEDEDDGDPMESAMDLFPLRWNTVTGSEFAKEVAKKSNQILHWSGFSAQATPPVPAFRSGTLRFRAGYTAPINLRDFVKNQLNGAWVGVAQVDNTGRIIPNAPLYTFQLRSPRILPAAPLYYKFDRGAGDFAVNHVLEYQGGPRTGTIPSNAWDSSGVGGGALGVCASGKCFCSPGWSGGAFGRFTIAWHMRLPPNTNPGSQASYVFRGPGGLECFTGGPAGKDIWCAGLKGRSGPVTLKGPDVQTLAAKDWVHVALRVGYDDATRKTTVLWFLDGKAQGTPDTKVNVLAIPEDSVELEIGGTAAKPNFYKLDEFRLTSQVASPAQIHNWSLVPSAVAAAYGTSGGCLLQYTGTPKRGKTGAFHVVGPPGSPFLFVVGLPTPQPFTPTFATGTWYVDLAGPNVMLGARTPVSGKWSLPLSIPGGVKAESLQVQIYMAPSGKHGRLSRPLSISIE